MTAGIDLALALVEDDCGADVAQTVARWLVMFLRRPGGQSQFAAPRCGSRPASSTPSAPPRTRSRPTPAATTRVPALAAGAGMSLRHFTRVFTRELGTTPGRYVERVRVEAACRLLETTALTVDVVARRCGFGTAETLRRSFLRTLGVPPDRLPASLRARRLTRRSIPMQIAAVPLFDRLTALDAIGPYEVLQRLPDAVVTFVGHGRARCAPRTASSA